MKKRLKPSPSGLTLEALDALSQVKSLILDVDALLHTALTLADFAPIRDRNFERMMSLVYKAEEAADHAFTESDRLTRDLGTRFSRQSRARRNKRR